MRETGYVTVAERPLDAAVDPDVDPAWSGKELPSEAECTSTSHIGFRCIVRREHVPRRRFPLIARL